MIKLTYNYNGETYEHEPEYYLEGCIKFLQSYCSENHSINIDEKTLIQLYFCGLLDMDALERNDEFLEFAHDYFYPEFLRNVK